MFCYTCLALDFFLAGRQEPRHCSSRLRPLLDIPVSLWSHVAGQEQESALESKDVVDGGLMAEQRRLTCTKRSEAEMKEDVACSLCRRAHPISTASL